VNRIGLDGNGLNYSGNTCLISPLGEVYATPDGQEHNQHSILHSDYLDEIRQKLPFLADSIPII
jgi:predicted amidohydrolase